MLLEFFIEGIPVPQGSFRHVGGGRIIAANPKLNAWREAIASVTQKSHVRLIEAPTRVELVFTLPRPKTVTRSHPTVKPDLDKLCRAVLDAISLPKYSQILADDSIVTDLHAKKIYGETPGVRILIIW